MAYQCVARNIDEFLHQLTRLVTSKHYFYFTYLLRADVDPVSVDQRIINYWDLDRPSWKRTARYRGRAPSIHYLRYGRFYGLLATRGRSPDGQPHPFFTEYQFADVRRNSIRCFGYAVKSTHCPATGGRRLTVRLDKDARDYLRADLTRKGLHPRYHCAAVLEAEIQSLPYQWYRPVREQIYRIVQEVNRSRRRAGLAQVHLQCIPSKMRPPLRFSDPSSGSLSADEAR